MFNRIFKLLLIIFWMILIFYLSSQQAEQSKATSSGFIYLFILRFFEALSIQASTASVDNIVDSLQFVVRKSAHFFIYFILGILVINYFMTINLNIKKRVIYSSLICLAYSISDEIHQLSVIGRAGEVRDIIIDTTGAMLGIFVFFLCAKLVRRIRYGL